MNATQPTIGTVPSSLTQLPASGAAPSVKITMSAGKRFTGSEMERVRRCLLRKIRSHIRSDRRNPGDEVTDDDVEDEY